jgi:conjugal transfer pilus assembly protein TraE
MNADFHKENLSSLRYQKNIFLALVFLLSFALILMALFLFWKQERIVIVPPFIEKEFWVDSKSVSPTYLEQFGYFLGELILTKSSQSAATQRSVVLRHTDPAYVGILNKKLYEEEQLLSK